MRHHIPLPVRALAAPLAIALIAAGCSSSKKSTTSTATTTATTAAGGSTSPTSAAGGAKLTASAPGITPTTITIGYVTSLTGASASSYVGSQGGAGAAIARQNAAGGVDGRQLKLVTVDDQSTTTGNLTAVQDLVSKGVFGIIDVANVDFGGGQYLNQQGVPTTGDCCQDAPWGQYSNFFSQFGGVNPDASAPVDTTLYCNFYKSIGVTKVAGFAYTGIPSSIKDIKQLKQSLESCGLSMPYQNLSVPLGASDFTTYALAMKSAGVQGGVCACVESSNLGMITAAKQAGINFTGAISQAGADGTVFTNASTTQTLQGTYWPTFTKPLDINDPAATAFIDSLKKYDPNYQAAPAGQPAAYPTYGTTVSYLGADFLIHGLEMAGPNPTRKSVIDAMGSVSNYDDNGLLPNPISWNHPGKISPTQCNFFTKVVGSTFVTVNGGKAFCGTVIDAFKSYAAAS